MILKLLVVGQPVMPFTLFHLSYILLHMNVLAVLRTL